MVRRKYRYLYMEYKQNENMPQALFESTLIKKIQQKVATDYGDRVFALASSELRVVHHHAALKVMILRTGHEVHRQVESALFSLPLASFTLIHRGGTIRSCKKNAIKHHRAVFASLE